MNAKVGDVDIAYDRQGEGEQVLLVMGLGTPRIGWFHQFYALSQSYDVTSFDNRGVGETLHPGGTWTMQDMVGDAIGLADAVGYERFHLVGISMGGMISQEIALAHPDRLRSLTLMATTPGGPEAVPMTPEYAAALMIPDPQERLRRTIEMTFGEEFRKHNPEMIDLIIKVQGGGSMMMLGAEATAATDSATALGFMGQVTAVGQWFFSGGAFDRLGEISVPTLVMHGGDDQLIPLPNGELLAREIRGAHLREWPKAGHALNAEYPDEVNAALMAHMQSASARV
jgi:3-oxoadipate enol-lactonase